jgi:hypothetical protein
MKRKNNILLILFLLIINHLSAQIVYDTIPADELEIGGQWWEELFIFRNFENQALIYFDKVNFENLDCYGEKVFVSTIFGKDGKIKNTRIVKSANPNCDSIAFDFVNGLKNWFPGMTRSKFVDIPFVFPITFDSIEIMDRYSKPDVFFNTTDEEYGKRKEYFDFVYSEQDEEEIINDYEFFKNYMAEIFRDSQYVYILSDYKLKRKESIQLEFNIPKSKSYHLLVRDHQKDWILYDYSLNKANIRVPKDKKLFLIFYNEGIIPKLQTMIIDSENDTTIHLELEKYTKGRLLDEIKKYSP